MGDFLASVTRKYLQREETIGATRRMMDLWQQANESGARETAPSPRPSSVPRPVVSLKTLYTDFEVRELPAFYGNGAPLQLELEGSGFGKNRDTEKSGDAANGAKRSREGDDNGSDKRNKQDDVDKTVTAQEQQVPLASASSSSVAETVGPLVSADDLAALLSGLAAEAKSISLPSVLDKEKRGRLHAAIRACLGATHVSNTVDGVVCVVKANAADRREERRRSRAHRPLPKYHHFTLYKENIDSNQALRMVATHLKLSSRQLQFCGTKDQRAVTLQRVAIRETTVERLKSINDRTFGPHNVIKVCGFTQEDHGLRLGDAHGNHFRIALRVFPAQLSPTVLTSAYLRDVERVVREYGVINYFGPQRFGTTVVLTSDVGVQFLRGNLREGLRLLLVSKATMVPEMATAVELFAAQRYAEALQATPYYCYHERDVLKHLSANPNDYLGALQCMARTMAMMYFHAVQSFVWNRVASARLSGPDRMHAEVGDLVLEATYHARLTGKEDGNCALPLSRDAEEGEEGEREGEEMAAADASKMPTVRKLVSAEECGRFTLADVLLPVPGPDLELVYPDTAGCSRADYDGVLNELQIDFQSPQALSLIKLFHFHGTYRALGVLPSDFTLRLETAASWRAPVLRSDWEVYCAREHIDMPPTNGAEVAAPSEPQGEIQVAVAAFSLPPGSYATSVLREFCIPSTEGFRSNGAAQDE